jgi:hypothetical protein
LQKFAGEGLRTLCLASRDLDEDFFNNWKQRHQEAAISLDGRDERLDAIYEEIERDMVLIGVTAIEDKLQDGVPQTIANLILAGIKIWVLTGDKQGEERLKELFRVDVSFPQKPRSTSATRASCSPTNWWTCSSWTPPLTTRSNSSCSSSRTTSRS